ncbi:MAG: hypothetical protein ACPHYG_04630, partial [Flavobacteriales bacterium]
MLKLPALFLALMLLSFGAVAQTNAPYFQQDVDHRIEVTLDDVRHELHGTITPAPDFLAVPPSALLTAFAVSPFRATIP